MSLFIACLVIYGLHLSPWLYPVAVVIFVLEIAINRDYIRTITQVPLDIRVRGEVESFGRRPH